MGGEKYIQELERRNGYCECPELQALFKKRRETERFVQRCDFFKRNVDLENPRKEDEQFLLDYRKAAENLHASVREYRTCLSDEARDGNLKLRVHDYEKPSTKVISFEEACDIQKNYEFPIITAHCFRCDQQVDVVRG